MACAADRSYLLKLSDTLPNISLPIPLDIANASWHTSRMTNLHNGGSRINITNELARIVGQIAVKHPGHSIKIRWTEGSDETYWSIVADNGVDHVAYLADDEQGTYAPATVAEAAAVMEDLPLVYPTFG